MQLLFFKYLVVLMISLLFGTSCYGQKSILIQPELFYRRPLWNNNMVYIRNVHGTNFGFGMNMLIKDQKHLIQLGYSNYNEGFRDIVRDEWKAFENFDTVNFQSKLNAWNINCGLNIYNKKLNIFITTGFLFSHWNRTIIEAYGPKNKHMFDTINKESNFRTGVWLSNGLCINYPIKRFELSTRFYSDVLFRSYWGNTRYLDALEPYPKASFGVSFGISYILSKNNHEIVYTHK